MAEYDSGYLYIEYIAQTEVGNMLVIGFGVEKYPDICAVMNLHTVVTGLAWEWRDLGFRSYSPAAVSAKWWKNVIVMRVHL